MARRDCLGYDVETEIVPSSNDTTLTALLHSASSTLNLCLFLVLTSLVPPIHKIESIMSLSCSLYVNL
jgi:hypothetical protein